MKFWEKCGHQWEVVSVAYTEPAFYTFTRCGVEGLRWVEKMSKGFTHVAQRCTLCGALTDYEMSGTHRAIKIDKDYGEQPAQRNVRFRVGRPALSGCQNIQSPGPPWYAAQCKLPMGHDGDHDFGTQQEAYAAFHNWHPGTRAPGK